MQDALFALPVLLPSHPNDQSPAKKRQLFRTTLLRSTYPNVLPNCTNHPAKLSRRAPRCSSRVLRGSIEHSPSDNEPPSPPPCPEVGGENEKSFEAARIQPRGGAQVENEKSLKISKEAEAKVGSINLDRGKKAGTPGEKARFVPADRVPVSARLGPTFSNSRGYSPRADRQRCWLFCKLRV
ncbi:hypothetical protein KM043_002900 [Ampulex compressa]|nr:hypothetical protein KM043_002900 [Ampulex compressa]